MANAKPSPYGPGRTDWRDVHGFRVRTVVHAGSPTPQAEVFFRRVVVGIVKPTLQKQGGSR